MARREASFVSVSARWAAVPPATTVDAISELRRASSASTEVTRTGIPPWASMRAYWPAPAAAISCHTCAVCASSAALDGLDHDPLLARLAHVPPIVEAVLVVEVRRRVADEHDHAQAAAGGPGEAMHGVVQGGGDVLRPVAAPAGRSSARRPETSSMSRVKSCVRVT